MIMLLITKLVVLKVEALGVEPRIYQIGIEPILPSLATPACFHITTDYTTVALVCLFAQGLVTLGRMLST